MDKARTNFLTPEQCAQQFEMYAQSHPSADSQHSLRFCANFLREFCQNPEEDKSLLKEILEVLEKRAVGNVILYSNRVLHFIPLIKKRLK